METISTSKKQDIRVVLIINGICFFWDLQARTETDTHTTESGVAYLLKVGSGNPAVHKMEGKKVHSEVETGWARRAG